MAGIKNEISITCNVALKPPQKTNLELTKKDKIELNIIMAKNIIKFFLILSTRLKYITSINKINRNNPTPPISNDSGASILNPLVSLSLSFNPIVNK
jgi:hypothetical protein